MSDAERPDEAGQDEPSPSEMQEPSSEKEIGEEPKAPDHGHDEDESEPSHRAVGIGVIAPEQPDPDEAPL